jgi:hypothetical protein
MRINLHYVAPVLAAGAAVFIAAATASAIAEPQPASTGASLSSPDHGNVYCGQFCGSYSAYGDLRSGAAAPALAPVGAPRLDPLHATSPGLPIVAVADPMRYH